MANGHGGLREGAGRKITRVDRNGEAIVKAEGTIATRLPQVLSHLLDMATGRGKRVQVTCEAAGTIKRKDVARDKDGNPVVDSKGRTTAIEVLAFPNLDPDEMVRVKRVTTRYEPSVPAGTYLVDRILGKPPKDENVAVDEGAQGLTAGFDLALLSDDDYEKLRQILGRAVSRRSEDAAGDEPAGPGAGSQSAPDP